MQKVRVLVDEPATEADPEAGTAALVRQYLASTVAPTSKGQAALDTVGRYVNHPTASKAANRGRADRTLGIMWMRDPTGSYREQPKP